MIQDIKRLLFFQKARTLCTLVALLLSLNYAFKLDFCYPQFSFLEGGYKAKKISTIREMQGNIFVSGKTKNGLEVIGLKNTKVYNNSILKGLDDNDLVISGMKRVSGKKTVRIHGQNYNALFTNDPYTAKPTAFTSFIRANDLLNKKNYYVTKRIEQTSPFFVQMVACLFIICLSAYFVFLKSRLMKALERLGIETIGASVFYAPIIVLLSISLTLFLCICKFCFLCLLFVVWHRIFYKEFNV